ncbi:MAG: response regulator [Desulfarculus sp.]|nr:response regulator [Desulfarculus sp.]
MDTSQGQGQAPMPPGRRVLVVDDEPMVLDVLTRYLRHQGLETMAAGDGQEALRLFSQEPCDLVISDLRMPGMDGLQLLHAIKGLNPRVPFIFISGFGDIPTVVEALKSGAENFLTKPLEMDLLSKVVAQSLSLAATQAPPMLQLARMRQITQLEVPSRFEFIRELVSQITQSAICVGYAQNDLDNNLKLALVEGLTNAMEHGNRWDENRLVRLEADLTSDCLKVTIEDEGVGFDFCALADPTCGEQLLSERGRGVFLMRAIMDEVGFNPAGNCLTLVKRRPPAGPQPAPAA